MLLWLLGAAIVVIVGGLLIRRVGSRGRDADAEVPASTYPETLTSSEASQALEAARAQRPDLRVSVYDPDTSEDHMLPISDELIRRAANGSDTVVTDDTGAFWLIPRASAAVDEEELDEWSPRTPEVPRVDYAACVEAFTRGGGPLGAGEWARRLIAGEETEALLNAWIGECAVFLPGGTVLTHFVIAIGPTTGWIDSMEVKSGPFQPIPTISEWGILSMALLLLAGGTVILRRRIPLDSGTTH